MLILHKSWARMRLLAGSFENKWGDGVGPTECAKLVEGFRIRQNEGIMQACFGSLKHAARKGRRIQPLRAFRRARLGAIRKI